MLGKAALSHSKYMYSMCLYIQVLDLFSCTPTMVNFLSNQFKSMFNLRDLTPFGRGIISKALVISKWHTFFHLTFSPKTFINKAEQTRFEFIWKSKPDKIIRDNIYNSKEEDGLKTANINHFIDALNKIAWVKRYLGNDNNGKFCSAGKY